MYLHLLKKAFPSASHFNPLPLRGDR